MSLVIIYICNIQSKLPQVSEKKSFWIPASWKPQELFTSENLDLKIFIFGQKANFYLGGKGN